MKFTINKILIALLIFLHINISSAMEVAITVDDLPANGNIFTQITRMEIAQKILSIFKKHHITGVYGLINGNTVVNTQNGLAILQEWIKEGHALGNHTFHHLDLAKTGSAEYITDIQKNEPILNQLMADKDYHYFRYPFLSEGNTQEKRDTIRNYLFKNNYKIAPVTVDFFEYEWNDPYVRCLNKHDKKSIEWLKKTYLEQANNALIISHELSKMLFNRDIKNVLLIYINSFTAEMLDELLTKYEKQNIRFIPLKDALSDPVYQINPNIARKPRNLGCYHTILLASTNKNEPPINEEFKNLETSLKGRIGLYAINTANNQTIQYRPLEHFPIQSTFKVMAVSAMLKKSESDNSLLKQKITYTKQDLVFWSPITEKHIADGMTIFDLCAAAMMYSDNTATNLIVKKLGGPQAVTAFARSIGDNTFRVNGWEPDLNSNPNDLRDTSTPKAMGKSLQKLTLGNFLTLSKRNQLVTWMKGNTTGDTRIRAGVPKGWIVADKTGSGNDYGISNDIGIIWPPNCAPIVIAIYSGHNKKDTNRRDDILVSVTQHVINELAKTDSCLKRNDSSI